MACIIKLPTNRSKGVVSFTTQEEKVLRSTPERIEALKKLKEQYVVCLHYNWHNYDCKPDDLFDIHLAGEDDLKITNGRKINRLFMDACNFVRPEFRPESGSKAWNVLFVGNPVFFKDPISFLKAIRDLYNRGKMLRALYICPLPPFRWSDRKTVVYNIRKIYDSMFSQEEQQLFNHLVIRENYPRFFDRQTLANFYRSSEVFVHTAPDERRCRVAGYAWASQMPVVGKDCVGSLLPAHLRRPPFFYLVNDQCSYADAIAQAYDDLKQEKNNPAWKEVRSHFASEDTVPKLAESLSHYFNQNNLVYDGDILPNNLDHRLGWHHGFGISTNTCNQNLDTFISILKKLNQTENSSLLTSEYPEVDLISPEYGSKVPDLNKMPVKLNFTARITGFIRNRLQNA